MEHFIVGDLLCFNVPYKRIIEKYYKDIKEEKFHEES